MSIFIKASIGVIVAIALFYGLMMILNPAVGWYGYKKWEGRVFSNDLIDSKRRKVFIKTLNYQLSYSDSLTGFAPYIEKGFKYGFHSSTDTRLLEGSSFPFQLGFNWKPKEGITILIDERDLIKFDSANTSWGFLKEPILPDTITLLIYDSDATAAPSGFIKVWENED